MRTMTQRQALDQLPDDSMVKKIISHIINTPPSDFSELEKETREDEERYFATLSPEQRERFTAWSTR